MGKKQRRNKEKGLLPRPNSSWVAGRNGFGPVENALGSTLHKESPFGPTVGLGHTRHFSRKKVSDQPVSSTGGASSTKVVESPADLFGAKGHSTAPHVVKVSATDADVVGKGFPSIFA